MSLFTHLLGLDPVTAGQSSYAQAGQNLQSLSGVAGQYGTLAGQAGAEYGQDDPAARQAALNQVQYLQQDPYSSAYSTAALSQATAGSSRAYQQGQSQFENADAMNGVSPDSSVARGQQQGLSIAQAGEQSGAENQLALNKIAANSSRLGQITGILGGLAQTDYGRQNQAMGAESGLYGNLANQYQQIGGAQHAAQAQANAGLFGGLGSIANLATRYYTGGALGVGGQGGGSGQSGGSPYGGGGYGPGTSGYGGYGGGVLSADNPYATG